LIYVGGSITGIAITTEVIGAAGVDADEDDVSYRIRRGTASLEHKKYSHNDEEKFNQSKGAYAPFSMVDRGCLRHRVISPLG
jgi:hypothetical protein